MAEIIYHRYSHINKNTLTTVALCGADYKDLPINEWIAGYTSLVEINCPNCLEWEKRSNE